MHWNLLGTFVSWFIALIWHFITPFRMALGPIWPHIQKTLGPVSFKLSKQRPIYTLALFPLTAQSSVVCCYLQSKCHASKPCISAPSNHEISNPFKMSGDGPFTFLHFTFKYFTCILIWIIFSNTVHQLTVVWCWCICVYHFLTRDMLLVSL
jgi:hypothetical protein